MTDTPLVVDALNFLTQYFMPVDKMPESTPAWRLLAAMKVGVKGFLKACAASGFSPHFVIDAGYKSDEASRKWTKRREKECRTGKRSIPLSADTFLAELLREAGAPVYQVDGEDGDDIAAMLAYTLGDNSLILSGDRDMFRYVFIKDAPKRVMADFSFEVSSSGTVTIVFHPSTTQRVKDGVADRTLADMPECDIPRWAAPTNKLRVVVDNPARGYVRGCCSPWTRRFGSLHGVARPLRLAAYHAMGHTARVFEMFPEWNPDADAVAWNEGEVTPDPDPTMLKVLESARVALEWLTRRDPGAGDDSSREGTFRCFARHAIVAEIIAAVEGGHGVTVLSRMRELCAGRFEGFVDGEDAAEGVSWPPADRTRIRCSERGCGASFVVNASERKFLDKKGFALPKRCAPCRQLAKERRGAGGRGAGSKPRDSPPLSAGARPFRLTPPRTLPPRPKPPSEVDDITKKMDELRS